MDIRIDPSLLVGDQPAPPRACIGQRPGAAARDDVEHGGASIEPLLQAMAVDEDRRRVQQEIHGHRGRKNDPLYGIRTILRCGQEKLTDRQRARLDRAIAADQRHDEILVAWLCAQKLRSAYRAKSPAEGRRIADDLIRSLPTCPIPESKRLGKTLKQWRDAFLAYFDTGRPNNGGTEAINELHQRVARGSRNRDHYRPRMLLIGGGLTHPHLR